jgi:hypothetical protein
MGFLIRAKITEDTRQSESIISMLELNSSWDSLTCSLLTFASFPPLSIYASLSKYRFPEQTANDWKKKRRTSFGTLSSVGSVIGLGLTFPLIFLKITTQKVRKLFVIMHFLS